MKHTFINSAIAAADIAGNRIIAAAANNQVNVAGNATDKSIGVSGALGGEAGMAMDLHQGGEVEVKLGGTVAYGDPITSGAGGVGVKAVPVAGSLVRVIGTAQADGVQDDIIPVLFAPGFINTPA